MTEEQRNLILWIRAVEEVDSRGELLSEATRERASKRARPLDPEEGSAEGFLIERADFLAAEVRTREPGLEGALRATRVSAIGILLLGGFIGGLVLEVLETDPRINLLALPLLGVVLWNGLLFGSEIFRALLGRSATPPAWLGERVLGFRLRRSGWVREGRAALRAAVVSRFGALWLREGSGPAGLRWRARLHLVGLALTAGIVCGLYTAGFALAYRASWESTFLDPEAVHLLFSWLLAPGVWLLDAPLPAVDAMAALEAPGDGPAAIWIHRWALSLLAWIGLPRLLLAGAYELAARRAAVAAPLSLEDGYFGRLLGWRKLGGKSALVIPYSTQLGPAAAALLRELLFELLGNRSSVQISQPVAYGESVGERLEADIGTLVLIFNLAQSPEQDVHGRVLAEAAERIRAAGAGILMLLDEESYSARADETRVAERRRSWQRVAREVGLVAIPFGSTDRLSHATVDAAARELGSHLRE